MSRYKLTSTYREKPRIGWACFDAVWLTVEAFYAGLSLAHENWWQLGISGVFAILFFVLMLLHIRTASWREYSVTTWGDGDEPDAR